MKPAMNSTKSKKLCALKTLSFSTVLAFLAIFAPKGVCAAEAGDQNSTVPIAKVVPSIVKTVNAPDIGLPHYQVLDGTHFSYRCYVSHTLKTNQAAVEVCEIDPVKLQIFGWPETEVIHLINGQVTITEIDGVNKTYSDGDIFVLPQGFNGVWHQSKKLLKVVVRHPLFWKE